MNTQTPIAALPAEHEIVEAAAPLDMEQSLAIGLSRAEIDQQIATARRFPRSIKHAINNILSLATLDEDTAEECIYSLPRGGKAIEGASIRLAEIIAQSWGNCRIATRVVHVDRIEKYIEAEGVYHDLETNMATLARVRRRIVDSKGRLYNDDMIQQTGNAAASIARRNAILAGVPKGVWWKGYDAARQVVMGDIQTLANRRAEALKAFQRFGVVPEQVFGALNVNGEEDVTLDHIVTMRGMFSALKNGEATVEEMFPAPASSQKAKVTAAEALASFAGEKPNDAATKPATESQPQETTTEEAPAQKTSASEPAQDKADHAGVGDAGPDLSEQVDSAEQTTRACEKAPRHFNTAEQIRKWLSGDFKATARDEGLSKAQIARVEKAAQERIAALEAK